MRPTTVTAWDADLSGLRSRDAGAASTVRGPGHAPCRPGRGTVPANPAWSGSGGSPLDEHPSHGIEPALDVVVHVLAAHDLPSFLALRFRSLRVPCT